MICFRRSSRSKNNQFLFLTSQTMSTSMHTLFNKFHDDDDDNIRQEYEQEKYSNLITSFDRLMSHWLAVCCYFYSSSFSFSRCSTAARSFLSLSLSHSIFLRTRQMWRSENKTDSNNNNSSRKEIQLLFVHRQLNMSNSMDGVKGGRKISIIINVIIWERARTSSRSISQRRCSFSLSHIDRTDRRRKRSRTRRVKR